MEKESDKKTSFFPARPDSVISVKFLRGYHNLARFGPKRKKLFVFQRIATAKIIVYNSALKGGKDRL